MSKARVLDVGNCDPDHAAICAMLSRHFETDVDRVMFVDEALARLRLQSYALVLVNRRIFADDSDGAALITAMRSDGRADTPIMLVSNFPDAQERAVAAGAAPGFGKAALDDPRTHERLAAFLPRRAN